MQFTRLCFALIAIKAHAVILTGALPGMYCGGLDLRMATSGTSQDFRTFVYKFYLETIYIQYRMSKPTIVAINGPARSVGMTLSITWDCIVAADDIDLSRPEIDVGVIPAIHYVHLPKQIGRAKAFELLFGGVTFSAMEAEAMGLINYAVPRDDLMDRACDMALGRQSFMRTNDLDFRRNVENQIETLCNVFGTPDGQEGLKAFLEKRRASWD